MKLIYRVTSIIVLLVAAPAGLSIVSRYQQPLLGLVDNRLRPCPATPNCICSEYAGQSSSVEPLAFSGDSSAAWLKAAAAVEKMGGRIEQEEYGYLHAVFTSQFFRFVDDLELRMDAGKGTIHLRSASRAGYGDFGVNRRRIEQFRLLMRPS